MMSPGRNPSRSPASTAGRVRMIRSDLVGLKRLHGQRDRQVGLPGTGRPDPEGHDVLRRSRRCRRFCPAVFGCTDRPRAERRSSLVSTSEGGHRLSPLRSSARSRPGRAGGPPRAAAPARRRAARPARRPRPSMVISLPRTTIRDPAECVLDQTQQLVTLAEQADHQMVARDADLDLGRGHWPDPRLPVGPDRRTHTPAPGRRRRAAAVTRSRSAQPGASPWAAAEHVEMEVGDAVVARRARR